MDEFFYILFACRVFDKMSQSRTTSSGNGSGSASVVRVTHQIKYCKVCGIPMEIKCSGIVANPN